MGGGLGFKRGGGGLVLALPLLRHHGGDLCVVGGAHSGVVDQVQPSEESHPGQRHAGGTAERAEQERGDHHAVGSVTVISPTITRMRPPLVTTVIVTR